MIVRRLAMTVLLAACAIEVPASHAVRAPPFADPLRARMEQHAGEMAALRAAMATLDYQGISAAARRIAAHPLVSALPRGYAPSPATFFALQDRMLARAADLAAAADAHDTRALEDAFDALTATCQSCHGQYGPLEDAR